METEVLELTSKLRRDPHFEAQYQKSWFLLNRGILELLKVVTAIHNPRAPKEVLDSAKLFNPLLWLSNWLFLNNPAALPYNAAIASMLMQPSSRSASITSSNSSSTALDTLLKRGSVINVDGSILVREKKRAHDIAVLSIYLFIECRRVERRNELDKQRQAEETHLEENYYKQVLAREARVRAKEEAELTNMSALNNGKKVKSTHAGKKKEDAVTSTVDAEEPPIDRSEVASSKYYQYVETPEEVLAAGFAGGVDPDLLVECIYNDKEALALLRLPARKPGSRPPFANLFRAVAPSSSLNRLGPGPGPVCECLWAFAFRHTTPLSLPVQYGIIDGYTPFRCAVDKEKTAWDSVAEVEAIREKAQVMMRDRMAAAVKELSAAITEK